MKRFFFWFFAGSAVFGLFFIGLNLFDSRPEPFMAEPLRLGAHLEPGNGFFQLWGFAEPAESDLAAPAFQTTVRDIIDDADRRTPGPSRYNRWLTHLHVSFRENWQGASLYFPRLPEEDVCAHAAAGRARIGELRQRFAVPLQRYQKVLLAGSLDDFTPLGWDFPARSLSLAVFTAKLHAASCALAALDGDWPKAGDGLFAALTAGLKLVAGGRTLAVNSLGKTMVELSLRTLVSLLNRTDCPENMARLVLEHLPARPEKEFGTAAARAFTWMSFAHALERIEKNQVVDPYMLKDYFHQPARFFALERFVAISGPRFFATVHALAAFFLKKNESAAALRAFWEGVGRFEETPPASWPTGPRPASRLGVAQDLGPFWWLRNPLGKMMVRSAVPFTWPVLQHYVYRSHGLKVRYDLTRLLAQARLQAGSGMNLGKKELNELLASVPERDPFSGQPYRFGSASGMLYSVGQDGRDNGGREQPASWRDSDIAVSIKYVKNEK